jgi:DNA-binding NarL/FixJ family response regulator
LDYNRPTKRRLSHHDVSIIALVSAGLKNKDVAAHLGTKPGTVKNQLRVIYDKLGFDNRVELALWYLARQDDKACSQ